MFVVGVGLVKVYSVSVTQLCDPMDCSLPGSLVHGILQAKVLEWVAIPSPKVDEALIRLVSLGTLRPPSDVYVRSFVCPFLNLNKTLLHKSS